MAQSWRVTNSGPFRDKIALDRGAVERLALAYVARYATSRKGLGRYLHRKVAEHGFAGGEAPDIDALVERIVALGYVNDQALAEARGRSLARRGYGKGRLKQDLAALGITAEDGVEAHLAADESAWSTALRFAERRRIGPFAKMEADEAGRRRAFAAMIRAGHSSEHARKIISAAPGILPQWEE